MKQFLEDVAAIETEKRPENHEVLLADMEMLEKLLADVNLDAVMGEGETVVHLNYCLRKRIAIRVCLEVYIREVVASFARKQNDC